MGGMRLERVDLSASSEEMGTILRRDKQVLVLSPDDLRWLCLVAGPALLNQLGKEATRGN
jgi:hypothetical protein